MFFAVEQDLCFKKKPFHCNTTHEMSVKKKKTKKNIKKKKKERKYMMAAAITLFDIELAGKF